ncbi:MAG: L-erythro-3,5-diaminohexanoate dehydrogenase [Bacillota bacterium]
MATSCPYGTHRVLEPLGVMPQAAWRLDNTPVPHADEVLIDVDMLNIDAASFTQLKGAAGGDPQAIAQAMREIVATRGKHHNPVTGSGGMLTGTVRAVGQRIAERGHPKPGDRIATLVSLTLTPLRLHEVLSVNLDTDQVRVKAEAILFASGIYAKLPEDMPEELALAVLDVAGAPAQTAKLVKPGDRVLVIGAGGKSGLLCLYEAQKRSGVTGQVIALAHSKTSADRARASGLADAVLQGDATQPLAVLGLVREATGGRLADVTINCVNIPGTEMASILSTRPDGLIYFFSMATSFTAAALGAEGIGHGATMLIGNGYTEGHAEIALAVLRESPALRRMFEQLFVK